MDRGAVLSSEQTWMLARAWYPDRRAADWRPWTRDETQDVLASVGLTGAFWDLPPGPRATTRAPANE